MNLNLSISGWSNLRGATGSRRANDRARSMDMLRALLLAQKEQSGTQGIIYFRDVPRDRPFGHQPLLVSHYDTATGRTTSRVSIIGEIKNSIKNHSTVSTSEKKDFYIYSLFCSSCLQTFQTCYADILHAA